MNSTESKLGQKLSQVHKNPNWPSWAHPGSTQARPGAHSGRIVALGPVVSWPGPAVSQAPSCRVASPARAPLRCVASHAMSRAYPVPCLPRAPRLSYRGPSGRVWALAERQPGHITAQCRALAGCVLGWLCCIATQPSLSSLGLSQYNFFFFVLLYKPSQPSIQ